MTIIQKINRLFTVADNNLFNISKTEQESFLFKIVDPIDDFERSKYQYFSQNFFVSKSKIILRNIFSLFLIFPSLLFLFIKYNKKNKCYVDCVFTKKDIGRDIIPNSLINNNKIEEINFQEGMYLSIFKDLKFIIILFYRFFMYPTLLLKSIIKIAIYRVIIDKYSPKSIIVCSEYSYTSSVLTLYCEENNIEHINIMHGDKLYNIKDSFFRFSKCFVWGVHYVNLFKKLRAESNQFRIEIPKSLKYNCNSLIKYDYKYFLASNSVDEIKKISSKIYKLRALGYSVMVRPHPRYSNLLLLKKYFESSEIENLSISIEESICSTKNVMGLYSTVLLQAYFSGKNIFIDDYSNYEKYRKLYDLEYIMLHNKNVEFISNL